MTRPLTPAFAHAPQPGRWSMIAYQGGGPLECNFGWKDWSEARAKRYADCEAECAVRRRFVLRNPEGAIVYDGPTAVQARFEALSAPTVRKAA